MNKTGPLARALFMSEKILPGKSAPSLGLKALTLTVSFEFKYRTWR
jgi:hypothetical protein